jgi:hypothetical protein
VGLGHIPSSEDTAVARLKVLHLASLIATAEARGREQAAEVCEECAEDERRNGYGGEANAAEVCAYNIRAYVEEETEP